LDSVIPNNRSVPPFHREREEKKRRLGVVASHGVCGATTRNTHLQKRGRKSCSRRGAGRSQKRINLERGSRNKKRDHKNQVFWANGKKKKKEEPPTWSTTYSNRPREEGKQETGRQSSIGCVFRKRGRLGGGDTDDG